MFGIGTRSKQGSIRSKGSWIYMGAQALYSSIPDFCPNGLYRSAIRYGTSCLLRVLEYSSG